MNQLVTIPSSNAEVYRASTDAAGLCREIVLRTAQNIQGRKYVKVEGWQAIAIAHGCTASADDVERVEDEGMSGFKATGIIRRMSDGAEIARAEGFLGDDEPMWVKRPVYARRAMVQTRAISRACRSAFAHVVVMIDSNLSTTPAEEVPVGGFDHIEDADFEPTPQPRMTAKAAREDGVYEALQASLRACQSEADLTAWAKANDDDLGRIPVGWTKEIRAEWVEMRDRFRADAADPKGLHVDTPDADTTEAWADYVQTICDLIAASKSVEEIGEVETINAAGIERAIARDEAARSTIGLAAEIRTQDLAEPVAA